MTVLLQERVPNDVVSSSHLSSNFDQLTLTMLSMRTFPKSTTVVRLARCNAAGGPSSSSASCSSSNRRRRRTSGAFTMYDSWLQTRCRSVKTERSSAMPSSPPSSDFQELISPTVSEHLLSNEDLVHEMRDQLILAPLTRGNNLPFRRLCCDFGATVTMSEMAYARHLLKGDRKEQALLRRAANESLFGVQIATKTIDEGVAAGKLAVEAGADWIDLNCGCPIHEATRRGLGSSLLRKPTKLARLVEGIARQLPVPLTVKVRIGFDDSSINVERVAELMHDAGAAALTIHGRTAQQRYKRPADWSIIEVVAQSGASPPVIGNGDILTHYEAKHRLQSSGCLAVMIGRGALIKPWCFEEFKLGREFFPTPAERVGIYRRLVSHMKEHFGDDERGKRKSFYFLPWHLGFFSRYRPLPESAYGYLKGQKPLISTRWDSVACTDVGESLEDLPLLERMLRCQAEEACEPIAHVLWDSEDDRAAIQRLEQLAKEHLDVWEESLRNGSRGKRDEVRETNYEG